jgi:GT2 family glycosyltransferase
VIVPTHRGAERVGALLDSLRRQSVSHQVLVVDNGSSDGTSEVLAAHPEAEVLRLERNEGFGRPVNLAAQRAEGDAIVLVNDDCVCDADFVANITAPIDAAAGVVMVAGVLRDDRDLDRIDTAGMQLDSTLLVFDYLNGEPLSVLDGPPPDPVGPCGAAAAFDREAFLGAGGFDEALFAYWEDVDLVLRLRRAGGRCRLAADARGTHLHSATLGSGSAEKNELIGYGRGYLLRKWSVFSPARAPLVLARDGVICAGQLLFDRNAAGAAGRLRGWRGTEARMDYPGDVLPRSARSRGTLVRRLRRRLRLRASR